MAKLIAQSPIFIPKPLDSDIAEIGLKYPAILMDANIIEWRPEVAKKMRGVCELFIANPVTHRSLYKVARDSKNFKKLPYAQKMEAEKLYSDSGFRTQFVADCIDDQIKKGAGIIIAPYLFAEDTDDTKFGLNITMLAESIRYLRDKKIGKPLFAMVCIGNSIFTRPTVINYIVDLYSNGYENDLNGYFVMVNEMDCRKEDGASLLGLANLVFQLSKDKNVFVKRVGAFGEVLSAIGADGFSNGLGKGETFSVKNLQQSPKTRRGRPADWIYIPEILDYANDEEARKIGYKCSCPACNGSIAGDPASKRRHLLHRRMEIMVALSKLSRPKRIEFMKERLDNAVKLVGAYIKKYGSPFKTTHLSNWRTVLEAAESWSHETRDDGLNELLADLQSKTK